MHDFKMKQLMGMMDGKCIDTVCNMMIVDSLLVNIGRSIGDIDMLYGDTFNILGVAPIFDFDNCLGWDIELEGKSIKDAVEEANARVNSNLGITFDEQAAAFADKDTAARLDAVDLDKLEADRMQGKLGLSEKRKEFIKALLRKRIEQVRAAITRSRIRG